MAPNFAPGLDYVVFGPEGGVILPSPISFGSSTSNGGKLGSGKPALAVAPTLTVRSITTDSLKQMSGRLSGVGFLDCTPRVGEFLAGAIFSVRLIMSRTSGSLFLAGRGCGLVPGALRMGCRMHCVLQSGTEKANLAVLTLRGIFRQVRQIR